MKKRMITLDELENCEMYDIEIDPHGVKCIHILCYYYVRDTDEVDEDGQPLEWARVDGTFLIVPLDEFIRNYKEGGVEYLDMELWAETKQYQYDMTEESAKMENADGVYVLQYSDLTMDTPCGSYVSLRK